MWKLKNARFLLGFNVASDPVANNVERPVAFNVAVDSLRRSSSGSAIPTGYWQTHSPFRRLQTFRPEDSWLFFGRDQVTEELLNRRGRAPATVVIGNSGSGKSSLVQRV
jgi:hypothetical protein